MFSSPWQSSRYLIIVGNIHSKKRRREALRAQQEALRAKHDSLLAKYGDEAAVEKIMQRMIWQGMTEQQLLDSWGAPDAKGEKIYKTKTTETFKYHQSGKNRYQSRVYVENGIVVGWEQK